MATATRIDMAGQRFGMWSVIAYFGRKKWRCRCDCGTVREVLGTSLRNGASSSCGCIRMEAMRQATVKHGMYASREYKIWTGMIQRCHNPKSKHYAAYGARGISVCDQWRHSFENFLDDMGPRPGRRHSLDRYPNQDGSYEPGNVRWATYPEQARNKSTNISVVIEGRAMCLKDACKISGMNYKAVESRIRNGWTVERALSTPINRRSDSHAKLAR